MKNRRLRLVSALLCLITALALLIAAAPSAQVAAAGQSQSAPEQQTPGVCSQPFASGPPQSSGPPRSATPSPPKTPVGDAVCAGCHQAIYASYEQTSMAQGSGRIIAAAGATARNLVPGDFEHQASGIHYRVFTRDGQAWMSYERAFAPASASVRLLDLQQPQNAQARGEQHHDTQAIISAPASGIRATNPLRGEQQLRYFIGSGKHGRTYLYQVAGTWFELPINYYTRRQAWDMAPAFDHSATMPANLPTDANCLHCHATDVAIPTPGSRSHYTGEPFAQAGIGCSACHGDPSAHLAAGGHGPIVNPARLTPARRDSACLSCHLEGDALVFRPGKTLAQFQPGDDLADTAVYFVRATQAGGGGRAASQYEALLRSACKRAVGDRLTCTTCHDPHVSPAPPERVAYYRARCLTCHTGPAMATVHHPEQQDCAHCHMPTRATTDISHEQTVDHDIERLPIGDAGRPNQLLTARTGETLLSVGGWKASDRELGMAYAQMAARGDRLAGERALALLARAEAAGASDPAMHAQLGFLRQMSGDRQQARTEYEAALKQNPLEPSPLANLAVLDASSGQVAQAVSLLGRLVSADPTQTAAGMNLAFIECSTGKAERARDLLTTLALYNPDDSALRTFKETGSYGGQHCDLQTGKGEAPHHAPN